MTPASNSGHPRMELQLIYKRKKLYALEYFSKFTPTPNSKHPEVFQWGTKDFFEPTKVPLDRH